MGTSAGSLLTLSVMLSAAAVPAAAQSAPVEISGAIGYSAAEGSLPPDLIVFGAGVAVWPSDHWGFAWSMSYGPGEQQVDPPPGVSSGPTRPGDRVPVAARNLLLHRLTLRYRREVTQTLGFTLGAGALIQGRYDEVELFAEGSSQVVRRTFRDQWGGFSTEALIQMRTSSVLSFQAGLIVDFALDRWYYQPVALAVVGF